MYLHCNGPSVVYELANDILSPFALEAMSALRIYLDSGWEGLNIYAYST